MAIAGLAVYFGSQVVFGLVLAIFVETDYDGNFVGINDFALSIMAIAVSALCTWAFYEYLKNSWRKNKKVGDYELLDEDLTE